MTDTHRIIGREARLGGISWLDSRRFGGVTRLFGALAEQARPACSGYGTSARNTGGCGQSTGRMSRERPPRWPTAAPERPTAGNWRSGHAGIPYLALAVARAIVQLGRQQVVFASGFFYKSGDNIYYITNRHVIIEESNGHYPDSIRLKLYTDPSNIASSRVISLDLYDAARRPVWREHPVYGKNVDVVAIPVSPARLNGCKIIPLSREYQVPDDIVLDYGQDLMAIGYPEGLSDNVHNLPIARNASLASSYMVPFNTEPYMLVDSRLHPGTSGSPIFTKPIFTARCPDGSFTTSPQGKIYLVGIHSAGAHLCPRGEAGEGKPLDLNICWFASLLDDMT